MVDGYTDRVTVKFNPGKLTHSDTLHTALIGRVPIKFVAFGSPCHCDSCNDNVPADATETGL